MPEDRPSLLSSPSQIALPLGGHPGREPRRLVIGNANAHAIDALGNPAAWPFRVAVLSGPPRSGKSLLARWAASQHSALPLVVIDNAEQADETELFHRWNGVQQASVPGDGTGKGALLLVVNADPANGSPWRIALPDLASRIGGSLQLQLSEPDDVMAADLLLALAEQRGLSLPVAAADYLVPRSVRSFAALEALVAAIDRISLERRSPATMSVWRAALEALQGPEQQRLL
ncbi:MAG: ATPase [Porphyrobacter sp.]|nr:ATPase [Porphyrobacter sp.]